MSSAEEIAALRKKRTFKKFTFRGIELDRLMDVSQEEFLGMINTRARRKMNRGIDRKGHALIEKLKMAKEACGPLDKPAPVKTHLRNMIIVRSSLSFSLFLDAFPSTSFHFDPLLCHLHVYSFSSIRFPP